MKVIAAYLLAVLGGNNSPSADDLQKILGFGIFSPLTITIFLPPLIIILYFTIEYMLT